VLCSPVAATRPAVNEEVRLFRSRHPDRPVIPVMIEGTWPDNFPAALRFALAGDGSVTDQPITILGPDLRESADGKNLGLAKAVSGLTGLGADDIFRRAERARRRRTRIWAGIAGLCILLAVAATGSAFYAWQQLKTNEAFLNATLNTATDIVNTAVAGAEKYNVPRAATLELLTGAEGLFDNMARYGRPTPELQYQKALMLIQFARNYAMLGDTGKEGADAEESYRLLAALAAAKPDDNNYQSGLAGADDEIGDVLAAHGDLAGALKFYRGGLAIIERLAKSEPSNASRQHDLAVSYIKVGDMLRAQNDLAGALQSYRESLAILDKLAQSDPGNSFWQRELSVSYQRVGDVQEAQGDLAGALQSDRDNLAIAERLAQSDPGNSLWQHDLALAYSRVGDVQSAQGDLADALKSYRGSLAIFERLAQSDPSNAGWQRDLALSNAMVCGVLAEQNDFAGALKSCRDSLAITQRLVALDPGNKQWRDDLLPVTAQIGSLLLLTRDFAGALAADKQAIALAPQTVALYINRADALMFLGRTEEARALYLKYRGQKDVLNGKSWEVAVVDDFADLRKAGLTNPLMDEIEKVFASTG
jgi:tetratricopeptide (TPR) repeat protein